MMLKENPMKKIVHGIKGDTLTLLYLNPRKEISQEKFRNIVPFSKANLIMRPA